MTRSEHKISHDASVIMSVWLDPKRKKFVCSRRVEGAWSSPAPWLPVEGTGETWREPLSSCWQDPVNVCVGQGGCKTEEKPNMQDMQVVEIEARRREKIREQRRERINKHRGPAGRFGGTGKGQEGPAWDAARAEQQRLLEMEKWGKTPLAGKLRLLEKGCPLEVRETYSDLCSLLFDGKGYLLIRVLCLQADRGYTTIRKRLETLVAVGAIKMRSGQWSGAHFEIVDIHTPSKQVVDYFKDRGRNYKLSAEQLSDLRRRLAADPDLSIRLMMCATESKCSLSLALDREPEPEPEQNPDADEVPF